MASYKLSFAILAAAMALVFPTQSTDTKDVISELTLTNSSTALSTVSTGRSFFPDPLSIIAALTIGSALKFGLLVSTIGYGLFLFAPGLLIAILKFIGLGSLVGTLARAAPEGPSLWNLEPIASFINNIPERTLNYMNATEPECRYDYVCGAARYAIARMPFMENWIKTVSGFMFLNLNNPYARAWAVGISKRNCSEVYNCHNKSFWNSS